MNAALRLQIPDDLALAELDACLTEIERVESSIFFKRLLKPTIASGIEAEIRALRGIVQIAAPDEAQIAFSNGFADGLELALSWFEGAARIKARMETLRREARRH